MKIRQFSYGADNLGYLLYNGNRALAIDGGAVDAILAFVRDRDLKLAWVTHTHSHADHTSGTRQLATQSGAAVLDHQRFADGQRIVLNGEAITVRQTPGHSSDSVCFAADDFLVTGDTLFNATVGNCFSGDLRAFFGSITMLASYPEATRIFAGHDYVMESLALARQLMPGNHAIDAYAARYDPVHVVSTLREELAVNPYLRYDDPEIIRLLQSRRLPADSAYQRWESIMSIT